MKTVEHHAIGMQEQGTFKATVPVRPGVFAQLLAHLLDGSEAFLGTLTWRRLIKRRESVALVDKTYTLFRATGHGYDLRIPQWQSLRVLELLVFYHDGSVLEVKLGSKSPYSYRILARGDEEARRRVNLGQVCLKRKPCASGDRLRQVVAAGYRCPAGSCNPITTLVHHHRQPRWA